MSHIALTVLLALAPTAWSAEPVPVPDSPCIADRAARFEEPERAAWFARAMERKPALDKVFEPAARTRDLPEDLLAVALVESGFDNIPFEPERSPSAGVWQFITATGRSYGLVVNERTDERMDVDKSTGAALDLLDDLHAEFGDWGLAFAAYNVGSSRVKHAVADHGTRDVCELIEGGALPPYAADVLAAVQVLRRR